jgi:hypothetical protein
VSFFTETVSIIDECTSSTEDIDHWHCCRDPDALLCGLDGTGCPVVQTMTVQCVVCEAEARSGGCPRFGRCVEDEEVHN